MVAEETLFSSDLHADLHSKSGWLAGWPVANDDEDDESASLFFPFASAAHNFGAVAREL